jgi:tyrosyl-tRNA synthetase
MAMGQFARLVTRWTPPQIASFESDLKNGSIHPRDAKMKLAHEITAVYYSEKSADEAQEEFVRLFQQGIVPQDMPEYTLQPGQSVLDVLIASALVSSRSDGRRMIEQKGVRLDGETLEKSDATLPHPGVLQVGKRRFLRVK